jgi:hypothetical protein
MFSSIIIECQTKNVIPSCEDCIAHKTCKMQRNNGQKSENPAVLVMETVHAH